VLEMGVSGNELVEAILLGSVEELAVLQLRPPFFVGRGNFVPCERGAEGYRHALIEEYAHLCVGQGAARSMV